jgi:MFS family permease
VVMPVVSARSGQLAARLGVRATITSGLLVLVAGLTLLSLATAGTPYWAYGLLLALVSAGMGLAMPPLSGMIVHSLPPSHAGVSSGLNSTTRELGSALGVAVLGTILTAHLGHRLPDVLRHVPSAQDAFVSGFGIGLRVGAALLLVVTVVVLFQHPERRSRAGR